MQSNYALFVYDDTCPPALRATQPCLCVTTTLAECRSAVLEDAAQAQLEGRHLAFHVVDLHTQRWIVSGTWTLTQGLLGHFSQA